ncbi:MAG: BTB/POZ domain-containing protein [Parachlamydiaceae bacterium]
MITQQTIFRAFAPFASFPSLFVKNRPNRITGLFEENHKQTKPVFEEIQPEGFLSQPRIKLLLKGLLGSKDKEVVAQHIHQLCQEAKEKKINLMQLLITIYQSDKATYFLLIGQVLTTEDPVYIKMFLSSFEYSYEIRLGRNDFKELIFSAGQHQTIELIKTSFIVNLTLLKYLFPYYQPSEAPLNISAKFFIALLITRLRKQPYKIRENNYKYFLIAADYFRARDITKECECWLIEHRKEFTFQKLFQIMLQFNLLNWQEKNSLAEVLLHEHFKDAHPRMLFSIQSCYKEISPCWRLTINQESTAADALKQYGTLKEQATAKNLDWKTCLRFFQLINDSVLFPLLDYALATNLPCAKDLLSSLTLNELECFFDKYGDLKFTIEQTHVPIRRDVLQTIPYFKAMFEHETREAKAKTIELKDLRISQFHAILRCYVLEESLALNAEAMQDILPAAHYLQLDLLIQDCERWCIQNLQNLNQPSLFRLAIDFNLEALKSAILQKQLHKQTNEVYDFFDQHQELLDQMIQEEGTLEKIALYERMKLLANTKKRLRWHSCLKYLNLVDPNTVTTLFNYFLTIDQHDQLLPLLFVLEKEQFLESMQGFGNLRIYFKNGASLQFHSLILSILFPSLIFNPHRIQFEFDEDSFSKMIGKKIFGAPLVNSLSDVLALYSMSDTLKVEPYKEELIGFFKKHTADVAALDDDDITLLIGMYHEAKKHSSFKCWIPLIEETLLNIAIGFDSFNFFPPVIPPFEIPSSTDDLLTRWLITKKTLSGHLLGKWLVHQHLLPHVYQLNYHQPSYEEIQAAQKAVKNGLRVKIHIDDADTHVIYWCASLPIETIHFAPHTTFTDFDILQLAKVPGLTSLSFSHTALTTNQMKMIPKTAIQTLDVSHCTLLTSCELSLQAFPYLKRLRLAALPINREEIKRLGRLKLLSLDLSSCTILKRDLLEVVKIKSLEVLNLSDLEIGDEVLESLSGLKLRKLIIKDCTGYSEEALFNLGRKARQLKIFN